MGHGLSDMNTYMHVQGQGQEHIAMNMDIIRYAEMPNLPISRCNRGNRKLESRLKNIFRQFLNNLIFIYISNSITIH